MTRRDEDIQRLAAAMTQPRPLVVWDDHVICPGCDAELPVITDGQSIYTNGHAHLDQTERDGTIITFAHGGRCGCSFRDCDDVCGALIHADLATERWTTDPKVIGLLVEHGQPIGGVS